MRQNNEKQPMVTERKSSALINFLNESDYSYEVKGDYIEVYVGEEKRNGSTIDEILADLTADEKQLLKDTINKGFWGDGDEQFLDENRNLDIVPMRGYCINDAHLAGHFKGYIITTMFKSIFKKLCPANNNQLGRYISHYNDWLGDGSGDMLFIRASLAPEFEKWAM